MQTESKSTNRGVALPFSPKRDPLCDKNASVCQLPRFHDFSSKVGPQNGSRKTGVSLKDFPDEQHNMGVVKNTTPTCNWSKSATPTLRNQLDLVRWPSESASKSEFRLAPDTSLNMSRGRQNSLPGLRI